MIRIERMRITGYSFGLCRSYSIVYYIKTSDSIL